MSRIKHTLGEYVLPTYELWRQATPVPEARSYYVAMVWVEGTGFCIEEKSMEKMTAQAEYDAFNGWIAAEAAKRIDARKREERGTSAAKINLEDLGL
jgi:hypothetical protein